MAQQLDLGAVDLAGVEVAAASGPRKSHLQASDQFALEEGRHKSEVGLARRLNDLHQLLYTRGGIRPVDAAVDELSKLLLVRLAAEQFPQLPVPPYGALADIVRPGHVTVEMAKAAFNAAVRHPAFAGRTPTGELQPVWPVDEPLRVSRADVLDEALNILAAARATNGSTSTSDPLGVAFDVFLQGKFEHSGGLGTHLTPATVAHAMARVAISLASMSRRRDWVVADPCCGTGRFLVAAYEELATAAPSSLPHIRLIGADQSPSAVAKARVNLLGFGLEHPTVFTVTDSITDTALGALSNECDLILTNPPFGEGKYDSPLGIFKARQWMPGIPDRSRIDPALAFVALCVDLLKDGGVLGIVLPDGLIEGPVFRGAFVETCDDRLSLEAVISLPSVTFAPGGTMAKTSAVFVRRGPSATNAVHIGRAMHVGYLKQKASVIVDPDGDDLPNIANAICRRVTNGSDPATCPSAPLVVSIERGQLPRMGITSFDPLAAEARAAVRTMGGVPLAEVLRPVSRRRQKTASDVPFVSVLHVNDLGLIDWRFAREYRPASPGLLAKAGDIIISLLNPSKFRASVIPDEFPMVWCSAEFGVFVSDLDPYGVLALLQHPMVRAQIAPMGRGTSSSRRRIDTGDVLGLLVPEKPAEWYASVGARVRQDFASSSEIERRLVREFEAT